jgi:hypothetical protein
LRCYAFQATRLSKTGRTMRVPLFAVAPPYAWIAMPYRPPSRIRYTALPLWPPAVSTAWYTFLEFTDDTVRAWYHCVPDGLSPGYPEMFAVVASRSLSAYTPKPNQPTVFPSSLDDLGHEIAGERRAYAA